MLTKIFKNTPYQFIELRKIFLFGIFPKLYCILREATNDGVIKQKSIPFKTRRFGDYPEYIGFLDVVINNIPQSYVIDKESYARINFRDKPVLYKVGNCEPYLFG